MFKTTTFAALALAAFTATAMASDLDRAQLVTTFSSGNLETSLTFGENDFEKFSVRGYVGDWSTEAYSLYSAVELEYDRNLSALKAAAIFGGVYDINPVWTAYGDLEVAYVAPTGALSDGEALITPTLGAAYTLGHFSSVFADVEYTYVASQSWQKAGGEAQIGVSYGVSENVLLTGSVVKPIDTANNDPFLRIETAFNF